MATSDEAMAKLCDALAMEAGAGPEFELDLGELVGRYRREHEKRMRDAQAAELLPLGADVAAKRLNRSRRAVYYMVQRHHERVRKSRQVVQADAGQLRT